jgi:N-ethylmaleimide reductase
VPFLANPDLPARLRKNIRLNTPDPATFYAGEAKGYLDYPALTAAATDAATAQHGVGA